MRDTTVWQRDGGQIGDSRSAAPPNSWRALWESFAGFIGRVKIRRNVRALRLEETLSLGDRRMLAIVEWQGEKLLLGVTPQQITLLETGKSGPRENSQQRARAEVPGQ